MAKFYGTLKGSRGEATRLGSSDIKVAARSYDGSLITDMKYDERGELTVRLSASKGSSSYGDTIFYGTLEDLINKLKK